MMEALEEDEKVKLNSLLGWLREQGGQIHDDIYFARDRQMGLSPYARNPIDANAKVVLVPTKSCITTLLAKDQISNLLSSTKGSEEKEDFVESIQISPKEWILLYLVLHKILLDYLQKRSNKEKDENERATKRTKLDLDRTNDFLQHSAYVDLLPEEILTPIHYNVYEITLLHGTPMFSYAIQRHQETRETCKRLSKWMLQKLGEVKDENWMEHLRNQFNIPDSLQSSTATKERRALWKERIGDDLCWFEDEKCWPLLKIWRWAETIHGSRAFPPRLIEDRESAPILIPCFDLFNHSREAKVTWTFEPAKSQSSIEQDCVTLTVHSSTSKDRQIFNSYGPKSNESLLASYGFVNDTMNDDAVTLKLGHKQATGAISTATIQNGNTKEKLYYWKFEEECPQGLLEEVLNIIQENADPAEDTLYIDSFAPNAKEEERKHILEQIYTGEAYQMIAEMAEKKLRAVLKEKFEEAKTDVNIRSEVLHDIEIYRKGQIRILKWAITYSTQEAQKINAKVDDSFH